MQLKSLLKSDPELRSYLLGTFSRSHVAIPLPSLNSHLPSVSEPSEYVFQIRERAGGLSLRRLLHLLKIKLWIWSLFPLSLMFLQWNLSGQSVGWVSAALAVLSVLCLQTSAQLWNDFRDHMVGFDHVHPLRGEKPILQAWVTAVEVRRWARIWLLLGLGLASPLIHQAWLRDLSQSLFLGGLSLGALFVFGFSRMGWRFSRSAELLSWALFGPLLTGSFEWALQGTLSWQSFRIGFFSGTLAFFSLQVRNFEFLLDLSRAGFTNWMTRLGFDRSRKTLFFLWIFSLFLGLGVIWHEALQVWIPAFIPYALVLSLSIRRKVGALNSSVGSALQDFCKGSRRLSLHLMLFIFLVHILEWLLIWNTGQV
ncbi:MAG: prenyltransferase [Bdellovibrio sp.]